jgi:hypothetical protein
MAEKENFQYQQNLPPGFRLVYPVIDGQTISPNACFAVNSDKREVWSYCPDGIWAVVDLVEGLSIDEGTGLRNQISTVLLDWLVAELDRELIIDYQQQIPLGFTLTSDPYFVINVETREAFQYHEAGNIGYWVEIDLSNGKIFQTDGGQTTRLKPDIFSWLLMQFPEKPEPITT